MHRHYPFHDTACSVQNYACRVTRRRGKRFSNTRLEYRGIVKYVFLLKRLLAGRRSRWQKKTKNRISVSGEFFPNAPLQSPSKSASRPVQFALRATIPAHRRWKLRSSRPKFALCHGETVSVSRVPGQLEAVCKVNCTINELCANEIATVEKLEAFVSRSRGSSTIDLERRVHDACTASLIEARICRLFSLSRVEPWLVLRNVSYYTKETLSSVGRRLRHRTVYRDAATIAAFSALVSQITSCPYVCSFLLSQLVPRCFCDWSRLPMEPPVN